MEQVITAQGGRLRWGRSSSEMQVWYDLSFHSARQCPSTRVAGQRLAGSCSRPHAALVACSSSCTLSSRCELLPSDRSLLVLKTCHMLPVPFESVRALAPRNCFHFFAHAMKWQVFACEVTWAFSQCQSILQRLSQPWLLIRV